jgi:hypothetical protein
MTTRTARTRSSAPSMLKGKCCESCWVVKCKDSGCSITVPATGHRALLSGSRYQHNHRYTKKLADFVLFWELGSDGRVAVLELKASPTSSDVVIQLQNGANLAEQLLVRSPLVVFRALLAHSKGVDPRFMKILRSRRITFCGSRHLVRLVRCGTSVDDCFH